MQNVVEQTIKLLEENTEWQKRYERYIDKIFSFDEAKQQVIKSSVDKFNLSNRLSLYTTVSDVTKDSISRWLKCFLHYDGQTIAEVKIYFNQKQSIKVSTVSFKDKNEMYYGFNQCFNYTKYEDASVQQFLTYFMNNPVRNSLTSSGRQSHNKEKRYEHRLLHLFSQASSKNKPLLYIQPISFHGLLLSMPTPISASKGVKYSGYSGGPIDIFTRVGSGSHSKLNVIELKDENKKGEPASKVIQQAVAYAVFILQLLRSPCGFRWYVMFHNFSKNRQELPSQLSIYATCLIPSITNQDTSFGQFEIPIGQDRIICHFIYFNESQDKISIDSTSLKEIRVNTNDSM